MKAALSPCTVVVEFSTHNIVRANTKAQKCTVFVLFRRRWIACDKKRHQAIRQSCPITNLRDKLNRISSNGGTYTCNIHPHISNVNKRIEKGDTKSNTCKLLDGFSSGIDRVFREFEISRFKYTTTACILHDIRGFVYQNNQLLTYQVIFLLKRIHCYIII